MPTPQFSRPQLLPLIGAAVSLEATVSRLGSRPLSDQTLQRTLALEDLQIAGFERIDHAWIRLGPNASRRAEKWGSRLEGKPTRLNAKVIQYVSEGVLRYGFSAPHNIEVQCGNAGRWHCLARNIERYPDDYFDDYRFEQSLFEHEREQQRPVLEQLQNLPKLDKPLRQILKTFFIQGKTVSSAQFVHAKKRLGLL